MPSFSRKPEKKKYLKIYISFHRHLPWMWWVNFLLPLVPRESYVSGVDYNHVVSTVTCEHVTKVSGLLSRLLFKCETSSDESQTPWSILTSVSFYFWQQKCHLCKNKRFQAKTKQMKLFKLGNDLSTHVRVFVIPCF